VIVHDHDELLFVGCVSKAIVWCELSELKNRLNKIFVRLGKKRLQYERTKHLDLHTVRSGRALNLCRFTYLACTL
jgi:hypothetical protein